MGVADGPSHAGIALDPALPCHKTDGVVRSSEMSGNLMNSVAKKCTVILQMAEPGIGISMGGK